MCQCVSEDVQEKGGERGKERQGGGERVKTWSKEKKRERGKSVTVKTGEKERRESERMRNDHRLIKP